MSDRPLDSTPESTDDTKRRMDAMYRVQRHIYDLTRKYYLLGRDQMIAELGAKPGQIVCEMGCGTGRNLIAMARRYPDVAFYGIDASEEMLRTATRSIDRAGLNHRITLGHGFAQTVDPAALFGLPRQPEHIVFSYALSIIPPWRESLEHAVEILPSGGTLHAVDFGPLSGWPSWFQGVLRWWLSLFHVAHRPGVGTWFDAQRALPGNRYEKGTVLGEYAELHRLRLP